MPTRFSTPKLITFSSMEEANASKELIKANEFVRVDGHPNQVKIGNGETYGEGSLFSDLPWIGGNEDAPIVDFSDYYTKEQVQNLFNQLQQSLSNSGVAYTQITF